MLSYHSLSIFNMILPVASYRIDKHYTARWHHPGALMRSNLGCGRQQQGRLQPVLVGKKSLATALPSAAETLAMFVQYTMMQMQINPCPPSRSTVIIFRYSIHPALAIVPSTILKESIYPNRYTCLNNSSRR